MFHKFTALAAALTASFCFAFLPATSYAQAVSPQTQTYSSSASAEVKTPLIQNASFDDIRLETRTKISETQNWVKDKKIKQNVDLFIDNVERKTDRLQDKVKPVGYPLKSFLRKKLPAKEYAEQGDKLVSFSGLLLIFAFGFVLILMTLSSPASRLGGRH